MGAGAVRPVVPLLVSAGESAIPTYALLDSGATCCAISEDLALKIGAKFNSVRIKLGTFDSETISDREIASFDVANLDKTFKVKVENALVGNIFASKNELPDRGELKETYIFFFVAF